MSTTIPTSSSITIRPAYADDEPALARLAALDSGPVPAAPVLLAEVDGELRAALSLHDSAVVADPFYPTLDLIVLVRAHARTRSASGARRDGWSRGLRPLSASI